MLNASALSDQPHHHDLSPFHRVGLYPNPLLSLLIQLRPPPSLDNGVIVVGANGGGSGSGGGVRRGDADGGVRRGDADGGSTRGADLARAAEAPAPCLDRGVLA
jgi:hypothetical protein